MLIHANDPYWPSVSLLVKNTGVNGANNNTVLDSSPNNFTITRNGNVAQGSFGPATNVSSGYFDGSGDYLSVPINSVFSFGVGAFTLETWFYNRGSNNSSSQLIGAHNFGLTADVAIVINSSNLISCYIGAGFSVTSSVAVPTNAWSHIAVTRSGTTITIWINGVAAGTGTSSVSISSTIPYTLGGSNNANANCWLNGYLALSRVSNITRYTSGFSPSGSYGADANSVLFLQFNNAAIYDATRKNNIETVNTTVSSTSIFNLNSIVFNSSSNLFIPPSTDFGFGSEDWTVDGWIYQPSTSADATLIDTRTASNAGFGIYSSVASGGNSKLCYANNSTVLAYASISFTANTWSYWMVKRTSGIVTGFVNGVQVFSVSDTRTLASSTSAYIGRNYGSAQPLNANTFDIRITKGIARPNIVPVIPFPAY